MADTAPKPEGRLGFGWGLSASLGLVFSTHDI
jgi:hypothetical protein